MNKLEALHAVSRERGEQDRKKREGRFRYTCADPEMTDYERFTVLGEEFGEVAQQCLTQEGRELANDTRGSTEGLAKELIQVAAVAVAWLEAL